jgi:histidinol-phosphate aminotransferase
MVGHGVSPDMVFVGNGSDEVLSFIFYTFFDSDIPLYFPEHTYSFYPVYAGYYGIPVKKIPLAPDFSVDIDAMLAGPSTGLIFANPNAPTGIFLSLEKIRSLLDQYPRDHVVVVDEAYIDNPDVLEELLFRGRPPRFRHRESRPHQGHLYDEKFF